MEIVSETTKKNLLKREREKNWKENNKERYLASLKVWRKRNRDYNYYQRNIDRCREMARLRYHKRKAECPEGVMLERARGCAKRKGMDFNISIEDIVVPSHCPILGIPLAVSKGVVVSNSPVLDRIDNTKGYVKNNVAVISSRANRLKSDLTPKQVRNLYEYVT